MTSRSNAPKPPTRDLKALRRFFAEIENDPDYQEMLGFWNRVDIAFVSVVSPEFRYSDVHRRLEALGLTTQEMIDRGARALVANRFLDGEGREVPLAEGVPSYEVAMPTEGMRTVAALDDESGRQPSFVVLDAWGEPAVAAHHQLQAGIARVVFADSACAEMLSACGTLSDPHD